MIALTTHAEGAVIAVVARPGARRSAVLGPHDGALRIAVNAAPEKGMANAALAAMLAELLGCRVSEVRLLSGRSSRRKRFLIVGMSTTEIGRSLERLGIEGRGA